VVSQNFDFAFLDVTILHGLCVFIFVATSMLYRTQLCKAFWCNFLTMASKPPKCQYDTATFGLAFVIKASYTR